jgi:hypothetical protein
LRLGDGSGGDCVSHWCCRSEIVAEVCCSDCRRCYFGRTVKCCWKMILG